MLEYLRNDILKEYWDIGFEEAAVSYAGVARQIELSYSNITQFQNRKVLSKI